MTTTVNVSAHPGAGLVCKVAQVRESDGEVVQTKFLRRGEVQSFYATDGMSIIVHEVPAVSEPARPIEQAELAEGAAEA